MSYQYNIFTGTFDLVGSAAATPTYNNLASFPGSAADGSLGVALDSHYLYVYSSADSAWKFVNPYEPVKIALYDNVTTDVTTSPAISDPFTVDGVVVSDGDIVLFSNLGSGNNQAYQASISAGVITWNVLNAFTGVPAPVIGDIVIAQQGTLFSNQVGQFNGSTWLFSQTVRYYNGSDYSQQDAIVTSTLTDNTSSGTVFSVAYLGSENMIIDFSLNRGGVKEAGQLTVTTDGTDVAISTQGSAIADTGVSFDAIISGSDIVLQYTTTSTGSDAVMKYVVKRWSDNAGGPSGVPSYSSGAASTPAAGSNNEIQINSSGVLSANSNLSYDSVNNILSLGALEMSILNSVALNDNQASAITAFSMPSTYTAINVEYSISRGSNFRTGHFIFSSDGTTTSFFDDYIEQGSTDVTFSSTIIGGLVLFQYTSLSTGTSPVFKYSFRRWSA